MISIEQFLEKHHPPGKVIFAKVWGSKSHNTDKEGSDTDFAGVYLCPTSEILSLDPPKGSWTHDKEDGPNKEDKPDHQFHEAGRFADLLLKGNPGLVETLFTERLFITTPEWEELRSIRDQFLCQDTVHQYLGYMNGQFKRLMKGSYLHTTGGNWNEKWVYHILRLAEDAKRIAKGQRPVVWKEGTERDFLMRLRHNEFELPEVKTLIEKAIKEVEDLKPFPLPKHGNKVALNEWLLKLRRNNW